MIKLKENNFHVYSLHHLCVHFVGSYLRVQVGMCSTQVISTLANIIIIIENSDWLRAYSTTACEVNMITQDL